MKRLMGKPILLMTKAMVWNRCFREIISTHRTLKGALICAVLEC